MVIISGRKKVTRKLGYVAEVCPNCRQIRSMKVSRTGMASHIFFVATSPGYLLDFVGECQTCAGLFVVQPTDYPRFQRRKKTELSVLVETTNPKLLPDNEEALSEYHRMAALRDPFLRFNRGLEDRYGEGSKFDWPSGLTLIATLAVPIAIWVWVAANPDVSAGFGYIGFGLFVFGLIASSYLLRTEPWLFLRRQVLPAIIEELRVLDPDYAELDAGLSALKKHRYRISGHIDAESLHREIHSREGLVENRPRGSGSPPKAAAPTTRAPAQPRRTPDLGATETTSSTDAEAAPAAGDRHGAAIPPDPLDRLNLRETSLSYAGLTNGIRVWHTPDGDGVGLYFFGMKPDLPEAQPSLEAFIESYRMLTGGDLVEIGVRPTAGFQIVRTIAKAPQSPSGMTYVGAFTIPFQDFSYVVKIMCEERGTTGLREAQLLDRGLAAGKISFNEEGRISGDWDPDDETHDAEFPDHPLSRCRRGLRLIGSSLPMSGELKKYPVFRVLSE